MHDDGRISDDVAGEGRHALYYSVLSSAFGSIVGLVALVLFAPMLSNVAVKFGPPEMLLVSLCGLTIVGSLTGKDIVKGLFAACFGLFLSMIGIDDISATFRFTFGTRFLRGGVDLIPAVIGLFAIAEMVKQGIASSTSQKQEVKLLPVRVRQIWHHIWHDRCGCCSRVRSSGRL